MTTRRFLTLTVLLTLACAGRRVIPDRPLRPDAAAREFTAHTRITTPEYTVEEKLYVGNGRTRSDSVGRTEEIVTLNDFERRTTLFLVTSVKTGLQMPELVPADEPTPDEYLAAADGRPCRTVHTLCERVGEARVGPFQTVEWRIEEGREATQLSRRIWVDQATRVIVKTVTTGSKTETVEFLDLQMGHQPDALFVVPEGYLIGRATKPPQ